MGLVNFVAEKKGDKKKSGDHTYRIKVGLSEKGTKFFLERNPVLLNYNGIATQRYHPTINHHPRQQVHERIMCIVGNSENCRKSEHHQERKEYSTVPLPGN